MTLSKSKLKEVNYNTFKKILDEAGPSYNVLSSLRSWFFKQDEEDDLIDKKIRHIQNRMKKMISENERVQKRRIPGTGRKVEVEYTYGDTAENRKLNRVGQTYKRTKYVDAEYEEQPQTTFRRLKLKRRRKGGEGEEPAPKRKNAWILASEQARKDMNAPRMTLLRKTLTNPDDEQQKFQHQVYLRAMELMPEIKARLAEEAKAEAEAESGHHDENETDDEQKQTMEVEAQ